MSKLRIAIASAVIALSIPTVALAVHTSRCCGDVICCLLHLGCCDNMR